MWKDEHRVFVVELFLKNTSFKEIYAKFWHKSECEKTPTLIYFEIIKVKILVVGEMYTLGATFEIIFERVPPKWHRWHQMAPNDMPF